MQWVEKWSMKIGSSFASSIQIISVAFNAGSVYQVTVHASAKLGTGTEYF